MRYEGPIYRPPSEANSLLIQATIGCPHNQCTFCMVYKKGPAYRVRAVDEIKEDLDEARRIYGPGVETVFFPAGNTVAMPSPDLAEICRHARRNFPSCRRITVYGSSQYIDQKSEDELADLAEAGLSRIHVGLESGDDVVLSRTKKGADAETQVRACRKAISAGLEISVYIVLGLGGQERTIEHAHQTVSVLNRIEPQFVRLRTFLPKTNTLMLSQVKSGRFKRLRPHQILTETKTIVQGLDFKTEVRSDHYTNLINVGGSLPGDREILVELINRALNRPESDYHQLDVGNQ